MTVSSANYVFLPWVRQGAAAGIQKVDVLDANQPGVVSVEVDLEINDKPGVTRQVRLFGPGDITGVDPQQVIRTEPCNLATDFEPSYFPAIEFDRPDFPWLFTPAKANDSGKLRPWLCLIVVRKQEGVTLRVDRHLPLPVLEIETPAQPRNELPDLAESWVWAHAQVTGSRPEADPLNKALAGDPALNLSRLLCPRRLDPLTEYVACVVPTFELGRKAGLGESVTTGDEGFLNPAWKSGAQSPAQVKLPVYYHWEFRTGAGSDFETLVGLLEPCEAQDLPPEVGKRRMDISEPGFIVDVPDGTSLELEGALRLLDAPVAAWPEETQTPFQDELKKILEIPWRARQQGDVDPLLAPPVYGCWQAARHTLQTSATPPTLLSWLDDLNLDPRHRAVAALGTAVVQSQQEQLMASAWEQMGELERLNQMRRQAQLARAVNTTYLAKHFARFDEERLLKVVASAQSRVVVETTDAGGTTRELLSRKIARSVIPDRAVSATLRRLASPRSAISARFQSAGAPPIAIVTQLNTFGPVVAARRIEAGLVTLDQVTDALTGTLATQLKQVARFDKIRNALDTAPFLRDFTFVNEGSTPKRNLTSFTPPPPLATADNAAADAFRKAARAHQTYLSQDSVMSSALPFWSSMNLTTTQEAVLRSVDPENTITTRVQAARAAAGDAETTADPAQTTADPLEPILDAPDFPQPMYEALRDLSQDFLFPGLEHVPPNTITLLETNSKFVESFMVGLNSEMGREFLWRDFPTEQRATFFRQFWDASAGNGKRDIEQIHTWSKTSRLGDNAQTGENLVLLIRGELLRRYPNSVIYAVRAVDNAGRLELSTDPDDELRPLFRGTMKPDVTFLGFDLTRAEAVADPGWFFVVQQQPTEPCFGMDVADYSKPAPPLTSWNKLSWQHMANSAEELKALSHASISKSLSVTGSATWGRNAAHQAYITLQRPVRIAIHAKEML
ncbi:MAG: hypothetical protein ABW250_11715 [Pyrinomonadaceae bacterium]